MSKLKRSIALLGFIIFMSLTSIAQDAYFSHIKSNDLYFNPAQGLNPLINDTKAKLDLQFRDQWNSIAKGDVYTTTKLDAEVNVYNSTVDAWNVGLIFLSDNSSSRILKQTSFTLSGSYLRKLSGSYRDKAGDYISAGLSYSFSQTNLDLSSVWFSRQFDITALQFDRDISSGEIFENDNTSFSSLIAGLHWTRMLNDHEFLAAGFSVSHINNPSLSEANASNTLPVKLNMSLRSKLNIVESFFHAPSIQFSYQAGYYQITPAYRLIVGIESKEESDFAVSLGTGVRVVNNINGISTDAIIFLFGISSETWSFDFSFDMTSSALNDFNNRNGAIELSLAYRILRPE